LLQKKFNCAKINLVYIFEVLEMSGYLKVDYNQLVALGEFIRSQRVKKDIGLREMAKMLDISSAYLSNLESGKHAMANPLLLKRIAEILEIDHLKLYKMIGYTNKDLDDITSNTSTPKINSIMNALEMFSEDEFELIERYIELLKKKK